ncbi:MAG: CdaR family protein [Anaerococcus sp.]|nr:CdaR family protein [Anaerococcus sp.]MDY2919551.1 CdaR family protein [Anaerococcus sp.]
MKENKHELQLIVLSILLALVMWALVTTSSNPSVTRIFRGQEILIKNKEKLEEKGYTIIGIDEITNINVEIEGSRDNIVGLKPNDIQASIDIGDVKEGIQSVPVKVDTPNGVNVEKTEPKEINVNVQKVIEKNLPINLVIDDSLKKERNIEVIDQSIKEVTVKGPVSQINNVDRAEVRIDREEYLDSKMHNININIVSKDGIPLGELEQSAKDIDISFLVSETKAIKVDLITSGEVADDYEITLKSVSPDEVIVKGTTKAMKDLTSIKTNPVDVSNIKFDKTGYISLNLPDGIEIHDEEDKVKYMIMVEKNDKTRRD